MPRRVLRGDRLRAEREKHQFTQQDLARACGIGLNQISRYENGEADPSPYQLKQLAKILQVTSDYLLGLVDNPIGHLQEQSLTADERRFLKALREGKIRTLLGMLQQAIPDEQEQTDVPGVDVTPNRQPLNRVKRSIPR